MRWLAHAYNILPSDGGDGIHMPTPYPQRPFWPWQLEQYSSMDPSLLPDKQAR